MFGSVRPACQWYTDWGHARFRYGVLLGCVEPAWKDCSLLDVSRGIATPIDAIKSKLTAGEIDELYAEIQVLSGYLVRTLNDVKNA